MEQNVSYQMCGFFIDLWLRPEMTSLTPSHDNPTFIQYSSFVLSILSCVLGLIGNMVVIIITGFVMKTHKSRIWFLNLAIADLMFLLILPLNAVSILKANWPYGEHVCKMYNFLSIVNMYASIFLITAMTFERFLSVMAPIWHRRFYSPRVSCCTCAAIWAVTALCSIPAILYSNATEFDGLKTCSFFEFDINKFAFFKGEKVNHIKKNNLAIHNMTVEETIKSMQTICFMHISPAFHNLNQKMYNSFLTTTCHFLIPVIMIGYFIPLCVIICSNVSIACKVRTSGTIRSSKLYVMATAAVVVFFITRTPLVIAQVYLFVSLQNMEFSLMTNIISMLKLLSSIANLNCCLNPFIYVFLGREVMSAFRNLIQRIRHRNSSSSSAVQVTS